MRLKKSLIFILLFLVANLCKAQNSEHLSFKGVPLDGTLNDYVKKMIQNGFKLICNFQSNRPHLIGQNRPLIFLS
jgi:hypothetical protein